MAEEEENIEVDDKESFNMSSLEGLHTDLHVDAYDQNQFEANIISKVDSALSAAERNFKSNILLMEIKNLEKERLQIQNEKDEIDKVFSTADEKDLNPVSFSLLQKRKGKETQIHKIENEIRQRSNELKQLDESHHEKRDDGNVGLLHGTNSQNDAVRLGEMTPFDALNMRATYTNGEQSISNNIQTFSKVSESEKSSSRNKLSSSYAVDKNQASEDKDSDYSPGDEALSTDDEDDYDEPLEKVKYRKINKVSKVRQKKSTVRHKKIVDDGDIKSFKERLKKLIAKKRVKEACRAGETQEEYHSSDFSESSDEDENVEVEETFVLPRKLWNKLYKYQRVGIKWLWQLHRKEVGGIIADEMGLGKTIQVIAFLAGLSVSYRITKNLRFKLGAVLIVCPATVMHQWVAEFHKWWPHFRVGILHDSGSFKGQKATLIRAINKHPGVLVTSYAGLRLNKSELYKHAWQYVILDEGHKIRNPEADITLACKYFDTAHRIILSGTPMQNSLKELWSLFDFVYPGKLGTLQVFMAEFSVPITMGGYANASSVQVQTAYKCSCILRDTIGPYILRRLKKDVQRNIELPSKNEQVLFCKLTEEQKDIYKQYINSPEVENMLKGIMKIFPGLIKLRKICNHPDLAFRNAVASKDTKKNGISKGCTLPTPDNHHFENGFGYWKRSGKMVVVEALLKIWKKQDHRVLVFTQSKQMLEVLIEFVNTSKYTYLSMDGTTNVATRQGLVKKFNTNESILHKSIEMKLQAAMKHLKNRSSPNNLHYLQHIYNHLQNKIDKIYCKVKDKSIFLFLLTTRVGGIGLNLTGANRVVIYDPDWNPSTDSQARERSWRIGQTKDVTIYRLMTTGSIEEKIYQRQIFKQFLANRILTNPLQRRFFKSNDLYELFTLGDIGPKQTSETGAIFAGTGSVIKFRQKSSTTKSSKSSSQDKGVETMNSLPNEKPPMNAKNTFSESSKKSSTGKKRKSRKRKLTKIDGEAIDDIDKQEQYKSITNDTEADENRNIESEKDVLLSLFLSSGIHSALKHDKIEQSSKPDYVLIEKEAERVAKQAVDALRKSRENYHVSPKNRSQQKSARKESSKPRFGQKDDKVSAHSVTTPKKAFSSSVDLSSAALLERMKNRNSATSQVSTSMIAKADETTSTDTAQHSFDEHSVLLSAQEFLNKQPNKSSTTEVIIEEFKEKVPKSKNAIFKEMLKEICSFSRNEHGIGLWTLKEEFHSEV